MEIKDITGVSFSSWGSSKKKRHLSISNGLFGQIVVDDQGVFAVVSEVLSNGAGRIRGQELKRGGFRSGSGDNDGVFHGVVFF